MGTGPSFRTGSGLTLTRTFRLSRSVGFGCVVDGRVFRLACFGRLYVFDFRGGRGFWVLSV